MLKKFFILHPQMASTPMVSSKSVNHQKTKLFQKPINLPKKQRKVFEIFPRTTTETPSEAINYISVLNEITKKNLQLASKSKQKMIDHFLGLERSTENKLAELARIEADNEQIRKSHQIATTKLKQAEANFHEKVEKLHAIEKRIDADDVTEEEMFLTDGFRKATEKIFCFSEANDENPEFLLPNGMPISLS